MTWRISLTVFYAAAFGALMALDNAHHELPSVVGVMVWLAAPVVGFVVGRWWVVLAVVGVLAGRVIGWDPGENDGNPALWPPYVVAALAFVGLPLLAGVASSWLWRAWQRPRPELEG